MKCCTKTTLHGMEYTHIALICIYINIRTYVLHTFTYTNIWLKATAFIGSVIIQEINVGTIQNQPSLDAQIKDDIYIYIYFKTDCDTNQVHVTTIQGVAFNQVNTVHTCIIMIIRI